MQTEDDHLLEDMAVNLTSRACTRILIMRGRRLTVCGH